MIIDFRLRPPAKGFLNLLMYANPERTHRLAGQHGLYLAQSARQRSMDLLFKEMEQAGISVGVMTGRQGSAYGSLSNADMLEIMKAHPGRFVALAGIDVSNHKKACQEIEQAREQGFRGVVLEPGQSPIPMHFDDRRMYPIYALCEEKKIPVQFLAGGGGGPDLSYTIPIHVDRVAVDFPGLTLIIAHGGWPWVTEMLGVAYRRPNVYLSPDQYLINLPGWQDYVQAANFYLQDRFLFGSSYPFLPVVETVEHYRKLPFTPAVLEKTLHANAARVLGL